MGTLNSPPASETATGTVSGITHAIILALALLRAVLPESIGLAIVETFAARESWRTLAHSSDVVTVGAVVAIARLDAVIAIRSVGTPIRTDIAHPTTGTRALASLGVTRSVVLASALEATVLAHRSLRTLAAGEGKGSQLLSYDLMNK